MGSSWGRGQGWGAGQGLGRGQVLGSRLRSRSGVKVRGQGHGVKVRVMIGGHKVGGQGCCSRSGKRSWGQVGEGSMFGVQVGGLRSGEGSRFGGQDRGLGCGQGQGQCRGVKVGS